MFQKLSSAYHQKKFTFASNKKTIIMKTKKILSVLFVCLIFSNAIAQVKTNTATTTMTADVAAASGITLPGSTNEKFSYLILTATAKSAAEIGNAQVDLNPENMGSIKHMISDAIDPASFQPLMELLQNGGTVSNMLNALGGFGYELVTVSLVVNAEKTISSIYYLKAETETPAK